MVDNKKPVIKDVVKDLKEKGIEFVYLQFSDILGIVKSVTIPLEELLDCTKHGKWFDGSSVEGLVRVLESDMYLKPDLSTLAPLSWEQDKQPAARVMCSVLTPEGELFPGDPRAILVRATEAASALDYRFYVAPELEFFLFLPNEGKMTPLLQDKGGYFDLSTGLSASVRKEMVRALRDMSIQVETSHHELGAGQHEIDFARDEALKNADSVITARYTLKALAQRHGLSVTFMPKPFEGMEGSGMHIPLSLFHISNGKNAFSDVKNEYGLSQIARSFLAGLLYHARGMCAILNPLVNSYKRLIKGFEAPVYISWARVNRSALIRVPRVNPQKLHTTRLEIRNPDPSCNPYLAYAVILSCGLHGIKEKLSLPPPVEENLFAFDQIELERRQILHLPETLGEALDELQKDTVIKETLGDLVFTKFLDAKRREWQDFCRHVTPWEKDSYLGVW
ncbi:MAG TPA: glutamine synthetase family protein [Dehalococcoidia bacterium]|nr:glutamine synthetase family protein [Dehalococcoidia bacterium]